MGQKVDENHLTQFLDRAHYLLYDNMMFNYNNNPEHIKTSINSFLIWSHEIFNTEERELKYDLQINYQKENYTIQHPDHKNNFFNYGYIGQFHTTWEENYEHVDGFNQYIYTDYYYDPYWENYFPTDSIYVSNYIEYTGMREVAVDYGDLDNDGIRDTIIRYDIVNDPEMQSYFDANGNKIDEEDLGKAFSSAPKPLLKNPLDVYDHPNEDIFIEYESIINFLPKVHLEMNNNSYRLLAGYQSLAENPHNYFLTTSNFMNINAFNPVYYYFTSSLNTSNPIPNPNLEPIKMGKSYFGGTFLIADPKYKQNIIIGGTAVSNSLKDMFYIDQIEYAFPKTYTTYNNSDSPINFWSLKPHLKYFYNSEPSITCGIEYTKNLYSVSKENQDKKFYLWNMSRNVINSSFSMEWTNKNSNAGLRNLSLQIFAHHRGGFEYQTRDSYSINGYGTHMINDDFDRIKAYSNVSVRIDKGYYLMKEKILLNTYVLVSNLFNRVNYFEVYPSTGEPDDDGFLAQPENQSFIHGQINPEIFKKQYKAKLENPYNFGLARQIKLGIQLVIN